MMLVGSGGVMFKRCCCHRWQSSSEIERSLAKEARAEDERASELPPAAASARHDSDVFVPLIRSEMGRVVFGVGGDFARLDWKRLRI